MTTAMLGLEDWKKLGVEEQLQVLQENRLGIQPTALHFTALTSHLQSLQRLVNHLQLLLQKGSSFYAQDPLKATITMVNLDDWAKLDEEEQLQVLQENRFEVSGKYEETALHVIKSYYLLTVSTSLIPSVFNSAGPIQLDLSL